jgi:hypothetical protein
MKRNDVLTQGCMLINDGSDDSVEADPFVRSKNDIATVIKMGFFPNHKKKRK